MHINLRKAQTRCFYNKAKFYLIFPEKYKKHIYCYFPSNLFLDHQTPLNYFKTWKKKLLAPLGGGGLLYEIYIFYIAKDITRSGWQMSTWLISLTFFLFFCLIVRTLETLLSITYKLVSFHFHYIKIFYYIIND